MNIVVSKEIESVCPSFVGACVEAQVVHSEYCQLFFFKQKTAYELQV